MSISQEVWGSRSSVGTMLNNNCENLLISFIIVFTYKFSPNFYNHSFFFVDKNVRVLEQQILQLQSQLQQQLNMRTMQQPLMTGGMQMPNMASPMVPTVDPNQG